MKCAIKSLFWSCLFAAGPLSANSWYERKLEGWYYFEEGRGEDKSDLSVEEAQDFMEEEKKKLKEQLSLALLIPTTENVESYIKKQRQWINQSSRFAETWGRVLLENPTLGDFLETPTTNYGILAKRDLDLKKRRTLLAELSKNHFLLFFFNGSDPFSEKIAEVVNLFASINNWKMKAVSLDGQGVSGLEDFEIDKGISTKMGVKFAPSLFVVNPFEKTASPVGAGLLSVSEIEQNIEMQLSGEKLDE